MKKIGLVVIILILSAFLFSSVHAQPIPVGSSTSSNGFSLGPLTSGNSVLYAGFFAIVLFIVFAIALDRTQLSSGRIAISLMFGLIAFFVLYTNSTLLHFFLNTFIVLAFIALILGMLALVKSPRSIRLIGLIVALFLVYILFANDSGLTNSVNSVLHINILDILPLILGAVTVLVIIVLLLRGIRNHKSLPLRVFLVFLVFFLIVLLIPGFASFLFSPYVGISLLVIIIVFLIIWWRTSHPNGPKPDKHAIKQQKRAEKATKLQPKILSSIANRKEANAPILQEYRDLLKKGNLSPNEQLRMAQLKNQLANEGWKNLGDRSKLSALQYKDKHINNKDLQKVTGFFSREPALRKLKSNAKANYKMSRSEKKALKKQQKELNKRDTFIDNSGNKSSGDLYDLANGVNSGDLGQTLSDKKARKLYEKRITKEQRQQNKLLKEQQKKQKEQQKQQEKLLKEQEKQKKKEQREELKRRKRFIKNSGNKSSGDLYDSVKGVNSGALGSVPSDDEARKLYEKRMTKEERKNSANEIRKQMLDEQRQLAEAARQEQLRRQEELRIQQENLKKQQDEERRKQEEVAKNQEKPKSSIFAPRSALDKRIKPPLWFSPKNPVDKNGKLDTQVQMEIEINGLTHRREQLMADINSGRLSDKELKNARNEIARIDYRLSKYGGEIHR